MKSQRLMRRICTVIAVMMVGWVIVSLGGCGTVGESASEIDIRHQRMLNNSLGRIQDDVDSVFLLDRPSRLSSQPVR